MRRCVGILLLLVMACSGTSAAEWLHVRLEHAHHADRQHAADRGPTTDQSHAAGPDEQHCGICTALHAPMTSAALVHLSVEMGHVAERAITLQAQRIDASVPAPRGCRGPPLV